MVTGSVLCHVTLFAGSAELGRGIPIAVSANRGPAMVAWLFVPLRLTSSFAILAEAWRLVPIDANLYRSTAITA